MNKIKFKTLFKNATTVFYYCECCEKFFLRYNNSVSSRAWKISPLRFSEFHQMLNVINNAHSDGIPIKSALGCCQEIKSLLELSEEEIEGFCEILDLITIEAKRIIFDISYNKSSL